MTISRLLLRWILYLPIFLDSVVIGDENSDEYLYVTMTPEERHPILLFTANNAIKMIDLTTKNVITRVQNVKKPIGITCDVSKNMVYWTDNTSPESSFHRVNVNDYSSSPEVMIEKGLSWPETVAFDWITGNLYYVEIRHEGSYAHIGFCHSEQRFCALLVYEDMSNPRGLALHPNKGILFYTDWSVFAHVTRCVMDGSNCQKIISSNLKWPNSITVDEKNSRIYIADAGVKRIESTTFEGTDRREIVPLSLSHPFGLALLENRLYWSDWTSDTIYSCNKSDGSNTQVLTAGQSSTLHNIAIVDRRIQPKYRENSCLSANCSHLCTLGLNNSSRCHCPVGMTLNTDTTSCIKCEEIFSCLNSDCKLNCNKTLHLNTPHTLACKDGWKLSTDGSRLCEDINECDASSSNDCDQDCVNTIGSYRCTCHSSYKLDFDGKRCIAEGLPPVIVLLNNSKIIANNDTNPSDSFRVNTVGKSVDSFDIDSHNRDIYWSNSLEGIIGKSDLNGKSRVIISGHFHPRCVAFDWVSNNIYFISSQTNDSNANSSLLVCHLGTSELCAKLYDLGNVVVTSLKLYPEGHNLFWIENLLDGEFRIRKGFLDGSDPEDCITDLRTIRGMSIHQARKKLFWIFDNEVLMEANLNCSNIQRTMGLDLEELSTTLPFDMVNYESEIIIGNREHVYNCKIRPTAPCVRFPDDYKSMPHFNVLQTSLQPLGNDSCKGNKCKAELCLPSKKEHSGYACLPVISDLSKEIENQRTSSKSFENETGHSSIVVIVITIIGLTTVLAVTFVLYYRKFVCQLTSPLHTRFRFNSSECGIRRKPADSIYGECSIDPLADELHDEDMWENIH